MLKSGFSCWRASWFSLGFVFEWFRLFQRVVGFGVARVFCPFEGIVRLSLKCSLGAHVEPVFQFLNVEFWFPMLSETCALGISFHFRLESLWVKTCFSLFFWISA
jgi:hypothetical protein